MSAPTAQEAFRQLARVHIAPELRRLGFKGSGTVFQIPDEACWIQLGIQRSVHSDARQIKFTINVQIIDRSRWDALRAERPYLSARPSPNTRYGPLMWHERIGRLMPGRPDHWWELTPATDLEGLGTEVVTVIARFAMPEIRRAVTARSR